MDNLVERLREVHRLRANTFSSYEVVGLIGRAADEIERLRSALKEIQRRYDGQSAADIAMNALHNPAKS